MVSAEFSRAENLYAPLDFDTRQARCRPDQALAFEATTAVAARTAKRVCAQCPIRKECLAFALRTHQVGVWGGTCDSERSWMRRKGVTA